jgi:hypothetical protein
MRISSGSRIPLDPFGPFLVLLYIYQQDRSKWRNLINKSYLIGRAGSVRNRIAHECGGISGLEQEDHVGEASPFMPFDQPHIQRERPSVSYRGFLSQTRSRYAIHYCLGLRNRPTPMTISTKKPSNTHIVDIVRLILHSDGTTLNPIPAIVEEYRTQFWHCLRLNSPVNRTPNPP